MFIFSIVNATNAKRFEAGLKSGPNRGISFWEIDLGRMTSSSVILHREVPTSPRSTSIGGHTQLPTSFGECQWIA